MKVLKTKVKITYKKDGNIKSIETPYDNDDTINTSFYELEQRNHEEPSLGEHNKQILSEMFFRFGEPYII